MTDELRTAKLGQVLLLNLSPKYRPIFCRLMKSADKIGQFSRLSVIGFNEGQHLYASELVVACFHRGVFEL